MPLRWRSRVLVVVVGALSALSLQAHANGVDTPSDNPTLPLKVEGVMGMTLYNTTNSTAGPVYVGIGTASPIETLEVNSGDSVVGANVYVAGAGAQGLYIQALDTSANAQATITYADTAGLALAGLAVTAGRILQTSTANSFIFNNRIGPIVLSADANFSRQDIYIATNGYVGFGTTNPSGRIDSETGTASLWAGMFNYNDGDPTGAYGVWTYGTAYGVYGQTVNGYGVQGNATGNGNGVLGTSASGWGGNFQGTYGVYGQSTNDGWAGEFNSTNSQNGVWIGNNSNNAQLCLNGGCVTSLSGLSTATLYQFASVYGTRDLGTHKFCVLSLVQDGWNSSVGNTWVSVAGTFNGNWYYEVTGSHAQDEGAATCFD